MKNPYHGWVEALVRHQAKGAALPLGGFPAPRVARPKARAPKVLIFSPHPDDECIVGGLALRLRREQGWRVVNLAVTLGSRVDRRAERTRELAAACAYLGFELELAGGKGLEQVTEANRQSDPQGWAGKVEVVREVLQRHQPRVILVPHAADAHPAHRGTHLLVMDALKMLDLEAGRPRPATSSPQEPLILVETEFWSPMAEPNLMVEISPRDLADLVAALSCHAGEVRRNPYHLRLPAWMQDNVRRGAERVGGPGHTSPAYSFAIIYGARRYDTKKSTSLRFDLGAGSVVENLAEKLLY